MKLKNVLIFGSLLLACGSLSAEIVDGVRVAPEKPVGPIKPMSPTGPAVSADLAVDVVVDNTTEYYMYNVTAKKFFLGANNWETSASAGDHGFKVRFEQLTDESGNWDGKTVIFNDYCEKHSKWMNTFLNATDGSSFVDRGSQANYYWNLEKAANGYYRLSMAAACPDYEAWMKQVPANSYFGLDLSWTSSNKTGDVCNELLNCFVTEGEGKHIDWMFITPESYDAYLNSAEYIAYTEGKDAAVAEYEASAELAAYTEARKTYDEVTIPAYNEAMNVYNTAATLKTAIDNAVARGLNVDTQKGVYLDETSTIEALEAATAEVNKVISEYDAANVDPKNPVDKTDNIINPNYDNNNGDGWSGTALAFQSYTNAEQYNKNYNTYQDLTDMPNGVYAVSVRGYYRAGSRDASAQAMEKGINLFAKLYAKTGADSLNASLPNLFAGAETTSTGVNGETSATLNGVTAYVPNTMESAVRYLENDAYKTTLFFATEDGNIRIGIKKDSLIDTDWTLIDSWTLTYYGGKTEAYALWMENLLANAPKFEAEGIYVTEGMIDAYNATVAGLKGSDKASIVAAAATIEAEAAKVQENINAWAAYAAEVERATNAANDPDLNGDLILDLADYVDAEAADILDALTMTTEEVKAETVKLTAMTDEAIVNSISEGTDVTDKFLKNPNYESGADGWNGNPAIGGTAENKCAEAYEKNFDVYQEVKDAPVGVYEVSVQAFYRGGNYADVWAQYLADPTSLECPVEVYVNNNASPVPHPFTEKITDATFFEGHTDWTGPFEGTDNDGNVYYFANGMSTFAMVASIDGYKSSAFGLVARKGDVLRLGIRKNTESGNVPGGNWTIWDNFRMVYQGKNAEVVAPYLETAINNAKATLEDATLVFAPSTRTLLSNAVAAGEAAGTTDGDKMFNALIDIYNANDSVNASVALMKELDAIIDVLYNIGGGITYPDGDPLVWEEASLLAEEIEDALANQTYENEDARKALERAADIENRAKLPAASKEASDENPIDMTIFIQSAGFEDAGANTVAGWEGTTGYNFGNDDTQKGALALEFYEKKMNMYQDITGLPNGTYKVTVNAFNRYGTTDEDYQKYLADPTQTEAYLYAETAEKRNEAPIQLLASGALDQMLGSGSESTIVVDADNAINKYVPNDMVSASAYFGNGGYLSEVYINVTDGKLRIGIQKDDYVTGSWLIMDNFTLTYYGTESQYAAMGIDLNTNAAAKVVSVEVYNVNGAKVANLQKGLNIVKSTLEDGSVIVRKTVVK